MSRHLIVKNADGEVVVGWDPPLGTFFAQIFGPEPEDPDEDENLIAWIGYEPRQVQTVEALAAWLAEHGVALNEHDGRMLAYESDEPWEPGPLQKRLGFTGKEA